MKRHQGATVLLIGLGCVLLADPQWHSASGTDRAGNLQTRVTELETRINALTERIDALERHIGRPGETPDPNRPPTGTQVPRITWDQAHAYADREVIVEGPVVAVTFAERLSGQPTFVNIGASYPDKKRFTVVIWQRDRYRFNPSPEQMLAGKAIRVRGEVAIYRDSPEMRIASPEVIEIIE